MVATLYDSVVMVMVCMFRNKAVSRGLSHRRKVSGSVKSFDIRHSFDLPSHTNTAMIELKSERSIDT